MGLNKCSRIINSLSNSQWQGFSNYVLQCNNANRLTLLANNYRQGKHTQKKTATERKDDHYLLKVLEEYIASIAQNDNTCYKHYAMAEHCFNQHLNNDAIKYLDYADADAGSPPYTIQKAEYAVKIAVLKLQLSEKANEWHRGKALILEVNRRNNYLRLLQLCDTGTTLANLLTIGAEATAGKEMKEIENEIKRLRAYNTTPLSALFYNVFLLLTKNSPSYYQQLKARLKSTTRQQIGANELELLASIYHNYIVRQINNGNVTFEKELFHFLEMAKRQGFLFFGSHITFSSYMNAAAAALRYKQFDWAANFIEDYKQHLLPEERDNAYNFSKGLYEYFNGRYKAALPWFAKVKFEHVIYKLQTRHIMLKLHYKLGHYDLLQAQSDSLKLFIFRSKELTDIQRTTFSQFNSFILKLSKVALKNSRKHALKLKSEIEKGELVGDKIWLLHEVNNLLDRATR